MTTENNEQQEPPKIECKRFVFGRLKLSTSINDENTSILSGLIQKLQSSRRSGSLPSKGSSANISKCDTNDLVHDAINEHINMFKHARVTSHDDEQTEDDTQPKPFISLLDGKEIKTSDNFQTNALAVNMKAVTYFGRTITSPAIRPPPMPIPIPPKNTDMLMASSRTVLSKPKFSRPIVLNRRFSETALQIPSTLKTNFIRPASDMSDDCVR